MADNRTYKTKVYLTCSNSQKNYNFAFDYINSKYIKATLNNTQVLQFGTDYTVKGRTLTLTNNPPQGALLLIYRSTPADRTIEWYDSSILRAKDMNLFNTQLLHINEENQDELLDSGIQEDKLDNRFDARNKQIKNVAEPTGASHAVNLGYLSKTQESYLNASQAKVNEATQQAVNAKTSADNAKKYAEQAKSSASEASVSESIATTKASEASVSESIATTKASEASTSATTADTKAREASISASTAGSHKETTKEYMEKTLAYKLEAEASAQLAEDHKMDSGTYAEMARQYRDETIERSGGNYVTESDFKAHKEDPEAHKELFDTINNKVESLTHDTSTGLVELEESIQQELDKKADSTTVETLSNKVDTKMPISGGTFTNNPNVKSGNFSGIIFTNPTNKKFIVEGAPDDRNRMGALLLLSDTNEEVNRLMIPLENGTLATKENISGLKTTLQNEINKKLPIKGGTITGKLSIRYSDWSALELVSDQQGTCLRLETSNNSNLVGVMQKKNSAGTAFNTLNIPVENGTLATREYVKTNILANRRVIVDSGYDPVTGGYWRLWSDNWIEQGGRVNVADHKLGSQITTTITYWKPFRAAPILTISANSKNNDVWTITKFTGINCVVVTNNARGTDKIFWEARGYKA